MKINKQHFISQDEAAKDALFDAASLHLSPLRYGILPSSAAGEDTYNVRITLDNQQALRVAVQSLEAITPGGVRISLPPFSASGNEAGGLPSLIFPMTAGASEGTWWVILSVNPYERQPAGSPDLEENPPRFPYVLPVYTLQVVSDSQYRQYAGNPYTLIIGKLQVTANEVRVDNDYIPPCFSISAHPDLSGLLNELDQFFGNLELRCSEIVQKIFRKNQQNDISELVMFLCDRMMMYLGQTITTMRWSMLHEPPASLFASIATLARVMKNTIDLRIGSGKEEMMTYLSEWCELRQGELEGMLTSLATGRFDNNDVNQQIAKVIAFVKVISKLFETLSKLEFIGKKKESGIFVKEETNYSNQPSNIDRPKRRFFG